MDVKVLGSGCANCNKLETRTVEALGAVGLEASIEKVTDYGEIAAYGVAATPALVIENTVVVAGRVPSVKELHRILAGFR